MLPAPSRGACAHAPASRCAGDRRARALPAKPALLSCELAVRARQRAEDVPGVAALVARQARAHAGAAARALDECDRIDPGVALPVRRGPIG
eukprot:5844054-Prymnesium_polylepis.1